MSEERRYREAVERVRAQVRAAVPEGSRVLVVSRGEEALLRLGRRQAGHFPQSPTGLYAGHYPADGRAAAEHLEDLRAAGAQYLVIPAEAGWWLEHYPELREALEREGEPIAADPKAAWIYKLPPASRSAARRSTAFAPSQPRRRRRSPGRRLPIPAKRPGAKRVLQICHNHPRARPGGAEVYAYELHRHLRDSGDWEPIFLARSGPPHSSERMPEDGTRITPVEGEQDEYLLHTEGLDFDWMLGTMRGRKDLYTEDLRAFLLALRPDVVHFQHTLFIGYDAIREVRRTLPGVPVVYTLHEFLPICHNKGQMVRTFDRSLCGEASPRRCGECFPGIEPDRFLRRERFIRAALDLVDLFVAPSETLRERYVEWGVPRERILLEDYGRVLAPSVDAAERPEPHDTLGIFGQVNPYKGFDVLLQAMQALGPALPKLRVHGANLDLQEHRFRDEIAALLAATPGVTDVGPYPPERAGEMMAAVDWVVVPSVWWENSPLVIQEAFAAGRPVICSDVGGMAEKVADGVNGLHFRVGDPESLAATIRRAVGTPRLWEHLRKGIPPIHPMTDHAVVLTSTYESLLQPELHQISSLAGKKSDAVRSGDPEAVA
jgi:glycosyltransferase involved in cell wall biosynthesis